MRTTLKELMTVNSKAIYDMQPVAIKGEMRSGNNQSLIARARSR